MIGNLLSFDICGLYLVKKIMILAYHWYGIRNQASSSPQGSCLFVEELKLCFIVCLIV